MRFSAAITVLAGLVAPAVARSVPVPRDDQSIIAGDKDDDLKIPGKSPLQLCPGDHSNDTVTIDKVDLIPNPPVAGQQLVIKAKGTVNQQIEQGTYVMLTVKYGLIRLITTKADFCEQIDEVNLKCPVEQGPLEITKSVDIPAEIPPGSYTVFADVYNPNDVQITCLTATVSFNRGGKSIFSSFEL